MEKLESFNEWFKRRLEEENKINRRSLLAGAGAIASGALLGRAAMAANTPAGSPGLPSPEDSIGMIPQVRYWDILDKNGHMENFDRSFVYIRFTDTPDVLSKVPRDSLSERDKEYVLSHENIRRHGSRGRLDTDNATMGSKNTMQSGQSGKEFNPRFGPQPPGIKNPKPIQVWKYQFRIIQNAEAGMRLGRRAPVDYVILYRYYNGHMPDPPEE